MTISGYKDSVFCSFSFDMVTGADLVLKNKGDSKMKSPLKDLVHYTLDLF